MNRRTLAVVGVVVLLAVGGAGALLVGGLSVGSDTPGPIGGGSGTTTAADSSDGGRDDGGGDDGSGDGTGDDDATTKTTTASDSSAPYRFDIGNIEKCGDTCRDVTATLTNTDTQTRQNVRVTTKMYADGDLLWTGNETVGTLEPDEAHSSTKRVKLSYWDGLKIKNNDGYVTIVTVVRSDGETVTFEERRKVA